MTVDIGDVLRVVAKFDIPDGSVAQLVYHYLGVSGTPVSDSVTVTECRDKFQSSWLLIDQDISDRILGDEISVFKYDFVNHQWDGIGATPLTAADGAHVAEMISHGASGLVKFFTGSQRRQGRKYLPGIVEGLQADGTITGAMVTDMALWAADLDNGLFPGSLVMDFGTFSTDVLSALYETFSISANVAQAEAIIAYQRRRRPGTGI